MDISKTNAKSKSLQRGLKSMSSATPSNESEDPDPALLERLGLLLGEHRVSTVKIQNHPHPLLSHNNYNSAHFNSGERRHKKHSHLTTSPASTLSDKGIGSSVGSFDSEFRNTLGLPNSKTGSLDSRTDISPSHSRTDSGIPIHTRSSSDIIGNSNLSQPSLSEQVSNKLWTSDPRRGLRGATAQKSATIDVKVRRNSKRSLRSVSSDKSHDSDRDSRGDVTKLREVCPRTSSSSSRDVTPSSSYTDVKRSISMHSTGYNNEELPPPPTPPSSADDSPTHKMNNNFTFDQQKGQSWFSHPSTPSSEKTLLDEEFAKSYGVNYTGRSIIESITGGRPVITRSQSTEQRRKTGMHLNIPDAVGGGLQPPYPSSDYTPTYYPNPDDVITPTNDIADIDSANEAIIQRMRTNSESGRSHKKSLPMSNSFGMERGRSPNRAWANDDRRETHNVSAPPSGQNHLSVPMSASRLGRAESAGRIVDHQQRRPIMHENVVWENNRPRSTLPGHPMVAIHQPSPSLPVTLPSQAQNTFTRHSGNRSSTRSNPDNRRKPPRVPMHPNDLKAGLHGLPLRVPDLNLYPIHFELPNAVTTETKFIGRGWVFTEILTAFNTNNSKHNKGVLIIGDKGHGKTSILHHLSASLVITHHHRQGSNASSNASTIRSRSDYDPLRFPNGSNFSSRSASPSHQFYHQQSASMNSANYSNASSRTASPAPGDTSRGSSRAGSQTSLGIEDACKRLASQVVAVHYCNAQDNMTCYVPEFIHSIAAQLAQAPMLSAYRDLLMREPSLQSYLRIRYCIQNAAHSLRKAIIEPLVMLRQAHKIPKVNLLILIDALGEGQMHKADYGHSIISFLEAHIREFPDFLKIIATCKSSQKNEVGNLPMQVISLDGDDNPNIKNDIHAYIMHRIVSAASLANLTLTGKPDTAQCQKLLTQHLTRLCQQNFLYLRLVLDLLEKRKLVPKSSGFKVIPINLSEVFLLMCNLRFQTSSSFDRVRDILAVCLASSYPLKDEDIFQAVLSGQLSQQLSRDEFRSLMESISSFLVLRPDGRRGFIHSCFRDWLAQGNLEECSSPISTARKFLVETRRGHALLSTVLSRKQVPLNKHATFELAHHLLKAGMFKGQSKTTGVSSSDLHALWMSQCNVNLGESLTANRNLFFPNLKVSKLLLRAGADPNVRSQVLRDAPAICVAAHIGCKDFVELLLKFNANINLPATNGMTALAYAAAAGHYHLVEYIIAQKDTVVDLVDQNGHSPLLHAISRGHTAIAQFILTCKMFHSPKHRHYAAEQALVAAATIGNIELMEFLLNHNEQALRCNTNIIDPIRGETPLTAAASRGKKNICDMLITYYHANIEAHNKLGLTPLLCAVKHGEWDTAEYLLDKGAYIEALDPAGRTPLLVAASYGNLAVLELLLNKGAILEATDKEGLTALGWTALKGRIHCAQALLQRRADFTHKDASGRTALDLAAFFGDVQVVELLLSTGANPSEKDNSGMTALDRAISGDNVAVVEKLLRHGVPIAATSWAMASGKTEVTVILLKKIADEGNRLYKVDDYAGASDLYSKALRHAGESVNVKQMLADRQGGKINLPLPEFQEPCAVLFLGLSRCARKLKDFELAECSSTRALELHPGWYEALYVRARVRRELSRLSAALQDVEEAQRNAPPHNSQEINRLIARIHEEIKKSGRRNSMTETTENPIVLPKTRHNSHSGRGLLSPTPDTRSRSSSPSQTESRIPQSVSLPNGQRQLNSLYQSDSNGLNPAESVASLSRYNMGSNSNEMHNRLQPAPYQQSRHVGPHSQQPFRHLAQSSYSRSDSNMSHNQPPHQMYNNGHYPNHPVPNNVNYGRQGSYQKASTPPLPPKTRPHPNDPRQQVYRSMSNIPNGNGLSYKKTIVTDL